MKLHWTERNIKAYLFRIVADFIDQIENKMEALSISQDDFAKKLVVSKGRVSQILNCRGNITLKTIVHCARTLGMKISMVAYEDDDPQNKKGPINPEVFRICWERAGKPRDLWAFQDIDRQVEVAANIASGHDEVLPAAIVPVKRMGLNKVDKMTPLSVDASEVNPK